LSIFSGTPEIFSERNSPPNSFSCEVKYECHFNSLKQAASAVGMCVINGWNQKCIILCWYCLSITKDQLCC